MNGRKITDTSLHQVGVRYSALGQAAHVLAVQNG